MASSLGAKNPFRYRGYYYDTETGYYYLNSRYYDPVTGRFLNADTTSVLTATPMALTDKNLYAYCDNNPVMRVDDGGEFWHIAIGAVIGAAVGAVAKVITNVATGQDWSDGVGLAALSGAASGALAATGVCMVGSIVGNAVISGASNAANQVIENKGFGNFNWDSVLVDATIGGLAGAIGGKGFGTNHLKTTSKQLTKRVTNAFSHNGVKAATKETKKAVVNYVKNTSTVIYQGVSGGVVKPAIYSTAMCTSYYYWDQYYRNKG